MNATRSPEYARPRSELRTDWTAARQKVLAIAKQDMVSLSLIYQYYFA